MSLSHDELILLSAVAELNEERENHKLRLCIYNAAVDFWNEIHRK